MPHYLRLFTFTLAFVLPLSACTPEGKAAADDTATTPATAAPGFTAFSTQLLESYWQLYPELAVRNGRYEFAGQLPVPDASDEARRRNFWQQVLADLQRFDPQLLNSADASDWLLIQKEAESALWYLNTFKAGTWDASVYNIGNMVGFLLDTEYAPLPERLAAIDRYLSTAPAFYQEARQQLQAMTLPHAELALQQNQGTLALLEQQLAEALASATLVEATRDAYQQHLQQALGAVQEYVGWLQQKLPALEDGLARDFRLGATLYGEKFQHDLKSGFTAVQAYQRALAEKARLHSEMFTLTAQLWPQYFPNETQPAEPLVAIARLISVLAQDHATPTSFISEVETQLADLNSFVLANDLLTTDTDKPLVVRPTPEYQRGFAVASIEAPGPYDSSANTYYNVEPLTDYSTEDAESFLREYNRRMMQILNIHEAIPGHYTQLIHANQSPSLIKAVFGNGTMIEGWAVYSERMMLEAGYGNNEPELWLLWYKWNLRVVVNTILDYQIQVEGLSEAAALDLLQNQAFQERTEATGKWRRATLSQVQLASYFTGYAEIYALQQAERQRLGERFNLKTFHDQFLSFGSAPVPVIKGLMAQ